MSAEVRALTGADVAAAARVLARAFRDNPMNVAVIGGDGARRERCNAAGVRAYLPGAIEAGCVLGVGERGRVDGVLVALPPGRRVFPLPGWRAWARLLWVQGPRVIRRFGEVAAASEALHPEVPHWTLATVGVDPEAQRAGVGSALVSALLDEVDHSPTGVHLDTDRAENLAFYRRFGFEEAGVSEIRGVAVHRMWRSP